MAGVQALAARLRPPRRPRDRSAPECSDQELRALDTLGRHGRVTMSQLAAQLGVPLSTASRTVDRLVAKRLVERKPLLRDRRIVHVAFSPRGRRINQYVVDARRAAAAAMLGALTERERAWLIERLARMVERR